MGQGQTGFFVESYLWGLVVTEVGSFHHQLLPTTVIMHRSDWTVPDVTNSYSSKQA